MYLQCFQTQPLLVNIQLSVLESRVFQVATLLSWRCFGHHGRAKYQFAQMAEQFY